VRLDQLVERLGYLLVVGCRVCHKIQRYPWRFSLNLPYWRL
jgi:hypothetical protein